MGGSAKINAEKTKAHLGAMEREIKVAPLQIQINFGEKFDEIHYKQDEKMVVNLLKIFAILGLSAKTVNEVMSVIAEVRPHVLAHQEKPK